MGSKDDAASQKGQAGKTSEGSLSGFVFDAGGLIALDRNDRRVIALTQIAIEARTKIIIPATALAQAIRNPARQARLLRVIGSGFTDVIPLDALAAQAVGKLLAATNTSDIVDAHVVLCAQQHDHTVITSDPFDLRRLDPRLRLIAV